MLRARPPNRPWQVARKNSDHDPPGPPPPLPRRQAESFCGRELTDDEKVPVLRTYLKRWKG